MQFPYISKEQMSILDQKLVDSGITVTIMMEDAGRRLAEFARDNFKDKKNVLLACGKGNNGGDGISAARHLQNFGFFPTLYLITEELQNEPLLYLNIAKKCQVPIITQIQELEKQIKETDIIYDCLIGYNLKGEPKDEFKEAIEIINKSKKQVISCDIPSGTDADLGIIHKIYIKADYIIFLSLPKVGSKDIDAQKYVADIGVPQKLYKEINIKQDNYFKEKDIIKI